ncbi:unnamed protein product [Adineta steineri]|uniref:Ciliary microtubule inner protein 2C n=2 Tax=Adineta steineri TaxID=433720 RepID=A0A815ZIV7_9BILA|nr:unnamed protein product [Adineta steineri]CAF1253685.1 unnamed protein product [Adineta steineri]CAF1343590.1 unnamed protein product [Adineta steineri]CAF1379815.1 unnamed protein product [Adineta steineri]CAF1583794.1 unnamed protein product [Adineta steineri]
MSRAAGTLQTTYNATYYPPSLMPGYRGHVPTTQYQYGETFGNATSKYFQDYRSEALNSSKSLYARGGYFPTPYTHQPELVMSDRRRSRDQYLYIPKYSLNNTNVDRTNEIRKFYQLSQQHRDTYTDRSGTLHPVEHFVLPVSNEKMYEANLPYSSMLLRHTSEINIPADRNFPPIKEVAKQSEFQIFPPIRRNSSYNGPQHQQQQQGNGMNASPTVDYLC